MPPKQRGDYSRRLHPPDAKDDTRSPGRSSRHNRPIALEKTAQAALEQDPETQRRIQLAQMAGVAITGIPQPRSEELRGMIRAGRKQQMLATEEKALSDVLPHNMPERGERHLSVFSSEKSQQEARKPVRELKPRPKATDFPGMSPRQASEGGLTPRAQRYSRTSMDARAGQQGTQASVAEGGLTPRAQRYERTSIDGRKDHEELNILKTKINNITKEQDITTHINLLKTFLDSTRNPENIRDYAGDIFILQKSIEKVQEYKRAAFEWMQKHTAYFKLAKSDPLRLEYVEFIQSLPGLRDKAVFKRGTDSIQHYISTLESLSSQKLIKDAKNRLRKVPPFVGERQQTEDD